MPNDQLKLNIIVPEDFERIKGIRRERQRNYRKKYPERNFLIRVNEREQTRGRNRAIVFYYLKAHPCVDCGERNPVVLEFDHLSSKKNMISALVRWGSESRLKAEIEKCEVRCANCHRIKTAIQFSYWKTDFK
jgi:hypothetical protein